MEKYLIYILIILFLLFITYDFNKTVEFFSSNNETLPYNISNNQKQIKSLELRDKNLSNTIDKMYKNITKNFVLVNSSLKKHKKNNKNQKMNDDEVKLFEPINIEYNNKQPFNVYSAIIGNNNTNKNIGTINNVDQPIIRAYNTIKEKYETLQKHIKHLNSIK
jgi:hypothetical protein